MKYLGRILSSTKELSGYYILIILTSVGTALLGIGSPFIIAKATDELIAFFSSGASASSEIGQSTVAALITLAVLLLACELGRSALTDVGGYYGDVMSVKMRHILSSRYYAKLLSLPQSYFDNQLTGTLISRLDRSIVSITQFLQSFSNTFASMLLTVVAILGVTAYYYWPLAVLLALIYPLYLWLTTLTSRKWLDWEGEKNEHIDQSGGRFAEVIGQSKVVKSFVASVRELGIFQNHFVAAAKITQKQSRYWHSMNMLRSGSMALIFFAIYLILFLRTFYGYFSLGQLVLLLQLVAMAKAPAQMMSYIVDASQRAVAGSKEYFEVMSVDPEPSADPTLLASAQPGGPITPPETSLQDSAINDDCIAPALSLSRSTTSSTTSTPVIDFDSVSFSYDGSPVLRDISFTVNPGEKLALVGESGGGKSTLVNLILGLYPPDTGEISILSQPISQIPMSDLRRFSGVVFQDPALFSGTIRENIAYARPEATDADVEEAARKANALGFISHFPNGMDTVIGERGLRLSGGQKQRIAIARALLKDAPILILDEATSALDTKAEREVQKGLDELMKGRTTIIIAHRLSTIAGVDTIITLDNGHVHEIGSPSQLAHSGGIYSQLLELTRRNSEEDSEEIKKYDVQ